MREFSKENQNDQLSCMDLKDKCPNFNELIGTSQYLKEQDLPKELAVKIRDAADSLYDCADSFYNRAPDNVNQEFWHF